MGTPRYVNLRVQQIVGSTTYEDRLSHYNPTPAHGGFLLDKSTPPPSGNLAIPDMLGRYRYLSGVPYCGLESQVYIGGTLQNLFKACYGPTTGGDEPVLSIDLGGLGFERWPWDDSADDLLGHIPASNEAAEIDDGSWIDSYHPIGTLRAEIQGLLHHPFGDVKINSWPLDDNARVINWPERNDEDTVMRFMDERLRCIPDIENAILSGPSQTADMLPFIGMYPVWDSEALLDDVFDDDNLQVQPSSLQDNDGYQGVLAYPWWNFEGTGTPEEGPDYSGVFDQCVYYGFFRVPVDVSGGRISWEGNFTFKDIENAAGPDQHVRIELRLLCSAPGGKDPSTWGDLGAPLTYDPVESGGGGNGHYWRPQWRFRGEGYDGEPGLYVGSPQPGDKFVDFAWLAGIHSLNGRSSDSFNYIGVKITYLDPWGDGELPWELDTLRFGWTTPQVIVAGGNIVEDDDIPTSTVESYSPTTNHWTVLAPLREARQYPISLRLVDGRVFVTGGYDEHYEPVFSTEIYNPTSNSWSFFDDLLPCESDAAICQADDETIIIAGGYNDYDDWASAVIMISGDNILDVNMPLTVWDRKNPAMAMAAYDGLGDQETPMLYGGWSNDEDAATDTIERYDSYTGAWHLLTGVVMSTPRVGHTATRLHNGLVVIIGGSSDYEDGLTSVDLHDAYHDEIIPLTPMPAARTWHTATLLADGRVLVVGGSPQADPRAPTNIVYILDVRIELPYTTVTRQTWTVAAPMNVARTNHAAELLPDGRVLIIGGFDAAYNSLSSCEIYDPVTNTWTLTESLHTVRAGFGCGSGTSWNSSGGGQ